MHPYVEKVVAGLSSAQINRICVKAGIGRMTVDSWIKDRRAPRIDLFARFLDAANIDVIFESRNKK